MGSPFRKKSLEKLSSPEQLDQLLQVTSSSSWLAFLSIAVLLVVIVIWSITGSIPRKTDGIGILLPEGNYREFSVQEIPATISGIITNLHIDEGDQVAANQTVANIQPDNFYEQKLSIALLQTQHQDLQNENETLFFLETDSLKQSASQRDRESAALQAIISAKEINLGHLQTIADNKELLAKSGTITIVDSVESASEVTAEAAELNGFRHQLMQQDINYENLQLETNKLRSQRSLLISQSQARITNQQNLLQSQQQIDSIVSGTVIQVSVAEGSRVRTGQRIAVMERGNASNLRLHGYVPIFSGKDITIGMKVQISPTTVKREEYGFLNGTVTWASQYPEGSQEIVNMVQNQELADLIVERTEIPLLLEIELDLGQNNTRYSWSTGNEPPHKLDVGIISYFSVITESKRPIELVIPYIKNSLGLD